MIKQIISGAQMEELKKWLLLILAIVCLIGFLFFALFIGLLIVVVAHEAIHYLYDLIQAWVM